MNATRVHWASRLAGAPISWGVCEVPGWGVQLPAATVFAEMAALGLRASEFGPDGFLPDAGAERAQVLARYGLGAVGGFVPVVLHRDDHDPVPGCVAKFVEFRAAGAQLVVLAAVSGAAGYEARIELDDAQWATLCANLDRLAAAAAAAAAGLTATLHPHVGTLVERPGDVRRVLEGSGIGLCLDTGHLMVGGGDPLEVVRAAAGRVGHVHLKDVMPALAEQVRRGALGYAAAVAAGMYVPLGQGGARIAEIVEVLEASGYQGWYVLEQDRVLTPQRAGVAAVLAGIRADVRAGLTHLHARLDVLDGHRGAA